jgi:putative phosphoesterase
MKILIVSDSHGHNEIIDDLIRDNKDVDIFLHAGDSEVPSYTLYPFRVVRGNCDYTFDMPIEFIIPSPFGNILLRHKDDRPTSYLKEHDIKIYIHGHTHVKECYKKNGICYINPGSLVYPRDKDSSYAVLKSDEKDCYLAFYRVDDKKFLKAYKIYVSDGNGHFIDAPTVKKTEMEEMYESLEELHFNALKEQEKIEQEKIKQEEKDEIDLSSLEPDPLTPFIKEEREE